MDTTSAWQTVLQTVTAEFSDIPDLAQATRLVLRLALAALLGGLLGWERESAGKAAGVRTHMLVAMGAALFVMLALQTGAQANEASRVMQGVIAGVGFLGAGTILKDNSQGDAPPLVRGLTTAAGIWLTAAIGVACGLGEEATAVLSALIVWAILSAVPLLLRKPASHPPAPASAAALAADAAHTAPAPAPTATAPTAAPPRNPAPPQE